MNYLASMKDVGKKFLNNLFENLSENYIYIKILLKSNGLEWQYIAVNHRKGYIKMKLLNIIS